MKLSNCIDGFGHLGVIVPDVDKAIEYYTCNLGFSLIYRKIVIDPVDGPLNIAFVKLHDMEIELFTPIFIKNEIYSRKDGVIEHFAIDCANIEEAYNCLLQKGLKIHPSTLDGITNYYHLGCEGVNFYGSFGEIIEICKSKTKNYTGCELLSGCSHVAIRVFDLKTTADFYEKLGFVKCSEGYVDTENGRLNIIFMSLGSFVLELIKLPDSLLVDLKVQTGHIDHFALEVSDIKNAFYAAKAEGFDVLNPLIKELNLFERGISYFMIKGPNSESIEIMCRN